MSDTPRRSDRHTAVVLLLSAVVTLALVATRWTPVPWFRSLLLVVATAAAVGRILCEPSVRRHDATTRWWRRGSDAVAAIGLGVCTGSREGPILGVLAAGLALLTPTDDRVFGPLPRWGVVAGGCAVGAVVILFGRYLHAWMQVPLIVLVIGGCVSAAIRFWQKRRSRRCSDG